jgi:hypothetical protein
LLFKIKPNHSHAHIFLIPVKPDAADGADAVENAGVADGEDGVENAGVADGEDEIPAFHGGDNNDDSDDEHAGNACDNNAHGDDAEVVAAAVDDAPEAAEATADVAD